MSDRTKLTLASLAVMMLPYTIDFPLLVLLTTAIMSTAIVVAREIWGRMQVSRKSMAGPFSVPQSEIASVNKVIPRDPPSGMPVDFNEAGTRQTEGLKYVAC
jgi:hypothetical protein